MADCENLKAALIDIASGEEDRRNRGIREVMPYCKAIVRNFARQYDLERDDALQVALMVVVEIAPHYDPSRHAAAYIGGCVANRLITTAREATLQRAKPKSPILRLDLSPRKFPDLALHGKLACRREEDRIEEIDRAEICAAFWRLLKSRLSRFERRVFIECKIKGRPMRELDPEGKGRLKPADNALNRIHQKIALLIAAAELESGTKEDRLAQLVELMQDREENKLKSNP